MANHTVRSLAVVEALKTCSSEELDAIAEMMYDRILFVYHKIDDTQSAPEETKNAAKNFAVMLLMDVQGKP